VVGAAALVVGPPATVVGTSPMVIEYL